MKQKISPILFSTAMVEAILEGRKTMTRRKVKSDENIIQWNPIVLNGYGGFCNEHGNPVKCKYSIGDILWVKEMYYAYGYWKKYGLTKTGKQKWRFIDVTNKCFVYSYFENPPEKLRKNSYRGLGWYKRNSLFMPKTACRIFLEITDIKVERLQDISFEDICHEGYDYRIMSRNIGSFLYFKNLWESINGTESWDQNPFVWVLNFERILTNPFNNK